MMNKQIHFLLYISLSCFLLLMKMKKKDTKEKRLCDGILNEFT